MAYLRYSNSRWYVYWMAGTDGFDTSRLIINMGGSFTAAQLRQDKKHCLKKSIDGYSDLTLGDVKQLSDAINRFLADIHATYGPGAEERKQFQNQVYEKLRATHHCTPMEPIADLYTCNCFLRQRKRIPGDTHNTCYRR